MSREDWLDSLPENGRKAFEEAVKMHSAKLYDDALNFYAMALSYSPDEPVILSNLGVLLRSQDKIRAAEECYRRALAVDPDSSGCWTNLGNVLRRQGQLKEAVYCHRKAFKLDRKFIDAYYNLGLVLQDMGKIDEAIQIFDFCLKSKPDDVRINWDRALALLSKGDFIQGFEAYEYRWYRNELNERHFKQPLWDGSPLNGRRIFLYSEQGFGDTLNFCRYVAEVAKAGGEVILECQKELVSLLKGLEGLEEIVSAGDRLPDFDVQAPLLSLPRIMKHDMDSIPSKCPYLVPPAGAGFPVHVPPGTKFKVGIVWAGKPTHKNDHNRSVDIENFLIFSRIPGVMLYSLQKGDEAAQREKSACGFLVRELASGCDDFGDTAKVLGQLDLVITVDTSVAHLAGALGIPVWVALPYNPDWRWMRERADSPWYPSMTLFRQENPGDWGPVFKEMLASLVLKMSE
ncbi:Glycosyltransferase family 9 (heptosyltransferase) [Maridesulfovibrio ferrireducens]|uniref:Glycosyltransferase family 9 (Heptosyltransferase) n=1 Tax=Maridesulfovibrio ferrireducens TaxID=246191 RepID=A0A1G9JNS4_9BACT|nr:tetratricopeptide repeat-containing glycosyltransferase family protein [Maridesulfovibrio ferrireducens]SDL39257.1 Glycosyltransferase family 9 (heptosyltransferase) [Maridesulfovibrio ferrireducens]